MMKNYLIIFLLAILPITANSQTKRVAILKVVDKGGNVPDNIKLSLRKSLTTAIANTEGYAAFDRVNVSSIIDELSFQQSGVVSEESIKRIGEMAGADYVLIAEAAMFDETACSVSAKMLNVETGKVERSSPSKTCSLNNQSVDATCKQIANKLLGIKMNYSQNAQELYDKGMESLNAGHYYDGNGVEHFNEELLTHAFECFKTASELNHKESLAQLSICYCFGFGTEVNYPLAYKYASQSANLGSINGVYILGECYMQGLGTNIDVNKAFQLFTLSAEKDIAEAQFELGQCYEFGLGCSENLNKARKWYRKAAKQGLPVAKEAQNRVEDIINKRTQAILEGLNEFSKSLNSTNK